MESAGLCLDGKQVSIIGGSTVIGYERRILKSHKIPHFHKPDPVLGIFGIIYALHACFLQWGCHLKASNLKRLLHYADKSIIHAVVPSLKCYWKLEACECDFRAPFLHCVVSIKYTDSAPVIIKGRSI